MSSSGRLFSRGADTVEVAFDKFWIDVGSTSLRPTFLEGRLLLPLLSCAKVSYAEDGVWKYCWNVALKAIGRQEQYTHLQ